jgi:hypothetical protein
MIKISILLQKNGYKVHGMNNFKVGYNSLYFCHVIEKVFEQTRNQIPTREQRVLPAEFVLY